MLHRVICLSTVKARSNFDWGGGVELNEPLLFFHYLLLYRKHFSCSHSSDSARTKILKTNWNYNAWHKTPGGSQKSATYYMIFAFKTTTTSQNKPVLLRTPGPSEPCFCRLGLRNVFRSSWWTYGLSATWTCPRRRPPPKQCWPCCRHASVPTCKRRRTRIRHSWCPRRHVGPLGVRYH